MECHIAVPKMSLVLILQYNKIVMSDSLSKELRKLCVFLFPSFFFSVFKCCFRHQCSGNKRHYWSFPPFFASVWKKIITTSFLWFILPAVVCCLYLFWARWKFWNLKKINALLFSDFSCMFLHALEGEWTFVLLLANALFSCNSFRNTRQRYCVTLVFRRCIDYRCEMKIFNWWKQQDPVETVGLEG